MTITIGTTTLNDHVSWRNRYAHGVPGSERVTLGNLVVINRLTGQSTPDIVLEAREEDNVRKGYFLKDELVALAAYRDSGEVVAVNYHGETFTAVVKIDGISVEKVLWQSQDTTGEKYLGTITLKRLS